MQRLLDLYLSGEFHKDMLIDKKSQLVKEIGELERERAGLLATIRARTIAVDDEETLGVEVILSQEKGSKTLRIKCVLGNDDKVHGVLIPNILIHVDTIRNVTPFVCSLAAPKSRPD